MTYSDLITSLVTGKTVPNIELVSEKTYIHNGQERTAYTILKKRSGKKHMVVKYENGRFASTILPNFS